MHKKFKKICQEILPIISVNNFSELLFTKIWSWSRLDQADNGLVFVDSRDSEVSIR